MPRQSSAARRVAAAFLTAATITTIQSTAIAATSQAAPAAPRVSVTASDTDVRSGEQLVLSGRLTRGGTGLTGAVQVWSRTGGGWYELTGAEVRTNRTGGYRVRVILATRGERQLKVVADPDARGVRNASAIVRVGVR